MNYNISVRYVEQNGEKMCVKVIKANNTLEMFQVMDLMSRENRYPPLFNAIDVIMCASVEPIDKKTARRRVVANGNYHAIAENSFRFSNSIMKREDSHGMYYNMRGCNFVLMFSFPQYLNIEIDPTGEELKFDTEAISHTIEKQREFEQELEDKLREVKKEKKRTIKLVSEVHLKIEEINKAVKRQAETTDRKTRELQLMIEEADNENETKQNNNE